MDKMTLYSPPPSVYLAEYAQRMKEGALASAKPLGQFVLEPLGGASVAGFQSLLVASQLAEHIEVLDNVIVLPMLIGVLRDRLVCSREKLFDSYLGFLSISLIIRTVQVGVLSRLDMFGPFLGVAMCDTEETITQTLSDAVTYELKSSMSIDGFGITPGIPLPFFRNGVLLPEVGGLSHDDLLFLLNALWEDRKQFLMVISHGSLFSLGWSALFCMMFKQFEAKKSSTTGDQWGHLRQLLYRYRLYTTEKDEELSAGMCDEIETRSRFHEFAELSFEDDYIDKEDAQLIVQAYIDRVASRYKSKGDFPSSMSLIRASQSPFEAIAKIKAYDLAPACTTASITHIWSELTMLKEQCKAGGAKRALEQILLHVCHISTHYKVILTAEAGDMSPEQRLEFLRALAEGAFVQIVSRTLLMYATHFAAGITLDYGGCRIWRDLIYELKQMATTLRQRYPTNPVFKLFKDCYIDLQRACHHNNLIMALSEPRHYLYKFSRDSLQVLDELLTALTGFNRHEFDHIVPPIECAYNRCPAMYEVSASVTKQRIACEGCLVMEYCSKECQTGDWEFGCPEPHRLRCGLDDRPFH